MDSYRKGKIYVKEGHKKILRQGPDLEKYLDGRKRRRYTTYDLGARMYSMNYYSFMKLVKKAGANIQIKKNVIIDLDILEAYLEKHCNDEGDGEFRIIKLLMVYAVHRDFMGIYRLLILYRKS